MVLCTGSLLGWGAGWSVMVRCFSLRVSCACSAIGVDLGVLDFKLANWSLSLQNCSNSSDMG